MPSRTHTPLAMSRDSMLAILAVPTRKTQTRRVIVPQPEEMKPLGKHGQQWPYRRGADVKDMPGVPLWEAMRPRYQPGQGVYFREPLCRVLPTGESARPVAAYSCDDMLVWTNQAEAPDQHYCVPWRWKPKSLPGYLMPKRLSRPCAVVSEVRAERVQDISVDDIEAEGTYSVYDIQDDRRDETHNRDRYADWWDSLNAKPRRKNRNPYTNEPEACYVGYPWEDVRTERKLANGKMEYVVGNPFAWITGWTNLVVGWQETQELIGET